MPVPSDSYSPDVAMASYLAAVKEVELVPRVGRVTGYRGLTLETEGPDAFVGELCEIYGAPGLQPVMAEVIGFRQDSTLLLPYGDLQGIRPGSEVLATGRLPQVKVGEPLLGRVMDAFGKPLDGKGAIDCRYIAPLRASAPNPIKRVRIQKAFETGVKIIDTCLPFGVGQRLGLFAGSGVGKSTLMGMIARWSSAEVNVIALIGERGREVRDFIEEHLGDGLQRSVVIVATADQPALVRTHAAWCAMTVAEYFRDRGQSVVLLMDSLTRLAMAQREVGLAAGEPPTSRGYTPSVFSMFPALLERAGSGSEGTGNITGLFTVLVEGDDLTEPVSDHARAILDGHVVLTRELANQGQFPAVDIMQSVSRLARQVSTEAEIHLAEECLALYALYDKSRDMLDFGAYKSGSNPRLDKAVRVVPKMTEFFRQRIGESFGRREAIAQLSKIVSPH
jgi:flagellum-specific ATP synthase